MPSLPSLPPEGQQGRPWAGFAREIAQAYTEVEVPGPDENSGWARLFLLQIEGAGEIPTTPAPGIRVWLPGENIATLQADPRRTYGVRRVGVPYLSQFLQYLGEGIEPEPEPVVTPVTELEPTPEEQVEPRAEPEAVTPAVVVAEIEPLRWTLIPDAQIGALEADQIYGWIQTLERDYGARPPQNSEFLPVEDLRAWLREEVQSDRVRETWERRQAEAAARQPPAICTTDAAIHDLSDQALVALQNANDPPEVFARAAQLVRAARDESGNLYIQEIGEAGLVGILDRLIHWTTLSPKGEVRQGRPPRDVVKDILALPAREWGVPPLVGVTQTPVLHTDGTVHDTPGYDEQTKLYYAPTDGFALPPIPERPTSEDVRAALTLIEEIFVDFPFVERADRANAYGALLTAVLRPSIDGPVPLYLCDKPQAGSGAGLLQRVIGRIALGGEPPLRTMPAGEEMRKELLTSLRQGIRIQIFDNIEDRLSSPELAAVLTAPRFSGRILGKSEEISLDVICFWMANGNNVSVGGDLARRTFKTRIDPQVAMPWQREGFQHPDLPAWVDANRGRILAAVFTLARAWIQADRPAPMRVPRVGSFEVWRDTIGGILEYAGATYFMSNADEVYLAGDADRAQWEGLLSALWGRYQSEPFTTGTVVRLLASEDPGRWPVYYALPDDLADAWGGRRSFSRILGKAFARQNGRHFPGGWCLRRGRVEHRAQTWVITYSPPAGLELGELSGSYGNA